MSLLLDPRSALFARNGVAPGLDLPTAASTAVGMAYPSSAAVREASYQPPGAGADCTRMPFPDEKHAEYGLGNWEADGGQNIYEPLRLDVCHEQQVREHRTLLDGPDVVCSLDVPCLWATTPREWVEAIMERRSYLAPLGKKLLFPDPPLPPLPTSGIDPTRVMCPLEVELVRWAWSFLAMNVDLVMYAMCQMIARYDPGRDERSLDWNRINQITAQEDHQRPFLQKMYELITTAPGHPLVSFGMYLYKDYPVVASNDIGLNLILFNQNHEGGLFQRV